MVAVVEGGGVLYSANEALSSSPITVTPAHLMAWWQMAGRLVVAMLILVGQAALGRWGDPQLLGAGVEEEAVALEDQGS